MICSLQRRLFSSYAEILFVAIGLSLICNTLVQAEEMPEIYVQMGHSGWVKSVAFSQDGRYVLSGSTDRTMKLWDVGSGREIRTFRGHTDDVVSVVFISNGKQGLSSSKDKTVKLWDLASGREIRTFQGHRDIVSSVAISSDGRYVLSGSYDRTAILWDISTGQQLRTYSGHLSGIHTVAFSPNSKNVIAYSGNGQKAWDLMSGKEIGTLVWNLYHAALSYDGKSVLTSEQDNVSLQYKISLRDVSTSRELRVLLGHTKSIHSVAISSDGKHALSGSVDESLRLWDLTSGREIRKFQGHPGWWETVAFSPDGKYAIAGGSEQKIILWDVSSGREIRTFQGYSGSVESVTYSPDGQFALSGHVDGTVRLWDLSDGRKLRAFIGHTRVVSDVAFSPSGRFALSGGWDKTLRLWDLSTGQELRTLNDSAQIISIAFSPDGKFVLSGGESKSLKLWNLETSQVVKTLQGHTDWVISVAFSPDGRFALSGSADNTIKLWEVKTGQEKRTFRGHSGAVFTATFSPDGRYILSGSRDKTMRLWDVSSGQEIRVFSGNEQRVTSVAFSLDGKSALSASGKTCKLWDLSSGREIRTFEEHGSLIGRLFLSPDGRYAIAGSQQLIIWNIATGKKVALLSGVADDWIAITPEGYYNSSVKGHEHLNIRKEMVVYGIDQYYDVFYRPDVVQAKLRGEDISGMIGITIDDAIKAPPPSVAITKVPKTTAAPKDKVCYQAKNTGGGIGEVRVFQNGKLVKSDGFYREVIAKGTTEKRQLAAINSRAINDEMRSIVFREKNKSVFQIAKPKGDIFEECVELETVPGENEVSVAAFNGNNTIQSYLQTVTFTSTRKVGEPHLYILAIGIDRYADTSVNLKYAAKDAKDFIAKLPEKAKGLYKRENIHVDTLLDNQATKEGIQRKIDVLATKVKMGDGFIMFVASHGVLLQDQYYIVTASYDGNANDVKKLVSSNEIVEISKKIKSLSQLFIFDTCHAGGVDNIISGLYDARMSVLAKKMGLHIYASAGSVQTAMDGYQGNGLYTNALLVGLMDKTADINRDKKVSVIELGQYTKQRTIDISAKLGHPQSPFIINFGRDNPLFGIK